MVREKIRLSPADYEYFEFHRHAAGLLPLPGDPRPGLAVIVADRTRSREKRTCTCSGLSQSDCPHVRRLAAIRDSYAAYVSSSSLDEDFRSSIWYRMAACLVTVSENEIPHRGSLLHRLTHLAFTETEKALRERHMESRRCSLAATFWHRFAYHC